MKRLATLVLSVLVGTSVFAGGKAEATASSGDGVLDIMAYGNNATPDGKAIEEIIAAFVEEKGLTEDQYNVEYLYDEAYHQKAQVRMLSGDVPDVMYGWASERASYLYLSGQAVDLSTVLDTSIYKDSTMVKKSPMKGMAPGVYVLPISLGINSVLYANTALLDELGLELPKTYDDLKAMKGKAEAAGYELITMANSAGWVMNSCLFGTIVGRTTGNPTWLAEATAGQHKFTEKGFVDSLKFIQTMYDDGVLTTDSLQTDYGTSLGRFISGKALFTIDGHWRVGGMEDEAFLKGVKMMAFPAIPGDKLIGSSAGEPTPGYTLTKKALSDPKVKDLAIDFLKFVDGPQGAKINMEVASLIPALKAPVDAKVSPQLALKTAFYASVPTLVSTPDQVMTSGATEALNSGMQRIGLGDATPEEVANAVEAAMSR